MKAEPKLIWLKQDAPSGCSKISFFDMVTWKPELTGGRKLRGIAFYPSLRKVATSGRRQNAWQLAGDVALMGVYWLESVVERRFWYIFKSRRQENSSEKEGEDLLSISLPEEASSQGVRGSVSRAWP